MSDQAATAAIQPSARASLPTVAIIVALGVITPLSLLVPLLDIAAQLWLPGSGSGIQFPAAGPIDNGPRFPGLYWTAAAGAAATAPVWLAVAATILRYPQEFADWPYWRFAVTIPLAQAFTLALCHRDGAAIGAVLLAVVSLLWATGWGRDALSRERSRSRRAGYAILATAAVAGAGVMATLFALRLV